MTLELIIDSTDREEEAYDILGAIGVYVVKDDICCNVLKVEDEDQLLVEEVMAEHGIEFQWGDDPEEEYEEE